MPHRIVKGWEIGEKAIDVYQSSKKPIIFAGDLHYGYKSTDRFGVRKFKELLALVKATDTKLVLMGDILENSIPSHMPHAGVMFQQSIDPYQQRIELEEILKPYRDNLVCILSGNHEKRSARRTAEDPTNMLCEKLDVPFVPISAYLRIFIDKGDQVYTGYLRHGRGGSQNPEYEIKKELKKRLIDVDFVGLAHIHQLWARPYRGRRIDKNGQVQEVFRWGFRTGGFIKDPAYAVDHAFEHSDVGYILTTFRSDRHEMKAEEIRMDMV